MSKYFALLTNAGAAKLANAAALGTKLSITELAVGDGGGALPTPTPTQTALINETRRAALNMLSIDPANDSQIIAEQVIPESVGGWWIREIGLYDDEGDLVAIANCPETYKPQLQEGSGRVQTVRMILIVSSTEAVTLKIDPSVVLATRKYVDNAILAVRDYVDEKTAMKLRFSTLSDLISLNSYDGSIDPVKFLGNVVTVDFNNKSSDNAWRGGAARYQIMTASSYGKIPDGTMVNGLPVGGDHYLAGGITYVAKLLGDNNGELDVEMFGSYQGQSVEYSTAAINSAINYADGRPIYLPAKKLRYEGSCTATKITLIGRKRPRVAEDKGSLVDGSVLIGNTLLRPVFGVFVNFGVDHGVDNFPVESTAAGDGLKISATTPDAGKVCIVHGCVGLGRRASDATHAILVEGFAHAEITSVRGVRNWFGLAAKITGGFIDGVTVEDNGNYAVILKTDNNFGKFRDVNISNVEIVGTPGVTKTGFEIEAVDNQQMQRVNISNINVRNTDTAMRINANGGTVNDVSIVNAFFQNVFSDAVVTLGKVYNLKLSNVNVIACNGCIADFDGVKDLSLSNFTGLATSGNQNFDSDLIRISSNITMSSLVNVKLIKGGYSDESFGAIKYSNSANKNKVANVFAVLSGTGAPV